MNYILMHKNVRIAELYISEQTGYISKIGQVYDYRHLPVGVGYKKGIIDRAALGEWWKDRAIPTSRSGVEKALKQLNITDSTMLLTKCFGLSLSDQYWIKPINSDIEWKDVNFFDNPFSEDIGDILFGKGKSSKHINLSSPDNTSDGFLKKRWKIIDGKRCLIKAGSNPFMQQPFNEVIASAVMLRLGIKHIPYTIIWDDGEPYSVCEDFVDNNTDLVSAWRVMQTQKKDNSTSVYQHYINCCKALGVDDIAQQVDRMIVVDYIISNEDRHQNNFGLIRNAETLEWIGVAPIYDSGSSLGYDRLTNRFNRFGCKPFKKTHEEQIKLVSSFDWIDFESLKGIDKEIYDILSDNDNDFIDEERKQTIIKSVTDRIETLQGMAQTPAQRVDDTDADVDEDVAEDYQSGITM